MIGCREHWFALLVRARHEKSAGQLLLERGHEAFVPLWRTRRRWSDRIKEVELPLFPCYAFCRFDPQRRQSVLSTPGVLRVVGFGDQPVPVEEAEIAAIRTIVEARLKYEPWPFVRVGQRVRIEVGSLRGTEGHLVSVKGRDRLVIGITLLQRSCAVEIDQDWVSPISPAQFVSESECGSRNVSHSKTAARLPAEQRGTPQIRPTETVSRRLVTSR
jgi:transcription antitermination factor NusG